MSNYQKHESLNTDPDPIYHKYFSIQTSTTYTHHPITPQSLLPSFQKTWEEYYTRNPHLHYEFLARPTFHQFITSLKKNADHILKENKVAIKWINSSIGYGVFAKTSFYPYEVLGQYTGIFTQKPISSWEYVCGLDSESSKEPFFKTFFIDSRTHGNWTRFMNHSPYQHPSNTVSMWPYYLKNNPHIIFTAGKNGISPGDQLLWDYGNTSYWKDIKCVEL